MPSPSYILFGTSGFQYPDWKGIVYPADVKKSATDTNSPTSLICSLGCFRMARHPEVE